MPWTGHRISFSACVNCELRGMSYRAHAAQRHALHGCGWDAGLRPIRRHAEKAAEKAA